MDGMETMSSNRVHVTGAARTTGCTAGDAPATGNDGPAARTAAAEPLPLLPPLFSGSRAAADTPVGPLRRAAAIDDAGCCCDWLPPRAHAGRSEAAGAGTGAGDGAGSTEDDDDEDEAAAATRGLVTTRDAACWRCGGGCDGSGVGGGHTSGSRGGIAAEECKGTADDGAMGAAAKLLDAPVPGGSWKAQM